MAFHLSIPNAFVSPLKKIVLYFYASRAIQPGAKNQYLMDTSWITPDHGNSSQNMLVLLRLESRHGITHLIHNILILYLFRFYTAESRQTYSNAARQMYEIISSNLFFSQHMLIGIICIQSLHSFWLGPCIICSIFLPGTDVRPTS